jgi:hypothetical protein
MTTLILSVFVAPVSAGHVYHGWAKYSPDLSGHMEQAEFSAFEVRDNRPVDIYHEVGQGNGDLYAAPRGGGEYSPAPNIYGAFDESPDIAW